MKQKFAIYESQNATNDELYLVQKLNFQSQILQKKIGRVFFGTFSSLNATKMNSRMLTDWPTEKKKIWRRS